MQTGFKNKILLSVRCAGLFMQKLIVQFNFEMNAAQIIKKKLSSQVVVYEL